MNRIFAALILAACFRALAGCGGEVPPDHITIATTETWMYDAALAGAAHWNACGSVRVDVVNREAQSGELPIVRVASIPTGDEAYTYPDRIEFAHIEQEENLSLVLAHEMGHTLGLSHDREHGIMDPQDRVGGNYTFNAAEDCMRLDER